MAQSDSASPNVAPVSPKNRIPASSPPGSVQSASPIARAISRAAGHGQRP